MEFKLKDANAALTAVQERDARIVEKYMAQESGAEPSTKMARIEVTYVVVDNKGPTAVAPASNDNQNLSCKETGSVHARLSAPNHEKLSQYLIDKLMEASKTSHKNYASREAELIREKNWKDLHILESQAMALETSRLPTMKELLELYHDPTNLDLHAKLLDLATQANSNEVTELLQSYYSLTDQMDTWTKLFTIIEAPRMDDCVRKSMADVLVFGEAGNEYEILKQKYVEDYKERHAAAINTFQAAEQVAANERQWGKAAEAQKVIQELRDLKITTIEHDFPQTLEDVQDGWLQRSSAAVEYLKSCLSLKDLDCERMIREIKALKQKNA